MSRNLLILACSQRKLPTPGKIAALQRYTGPSFLVLKKFFTAKGVGKQPGFSSILNTKKSKLDLTVYILSAKYGLISAFAEIPDYNQRLETEEDCERCAKIVGDGFSDLILHGEYDKIGLGVSKIYSKVIDLTIGLGNLPENVVFLDGKQGVRLKKLKDWLHTLEGGLP